MVDFNLDDDVDMWDVAQEALDQLHEQAEDPKVQYELEAAMEHYVAADQERYLEK